MTCTASRGKFSILLLAWLLSLSVIGLNALPRPAQALPVAAPELSETLPLLHADQVHQLGITGKGVTVAVIDIFSPNPNDPCSLAHGVWIEGLIHGVAPDARILRYDVHTAPSGAPNTCYIMSSSDIKGALRSILAEHERLGIRVVNLSWGGGQFTSPCQLRNNETTKLIQALVKEGVAVVAAAGNEGWSNALIWPACMPEVISVGASFDYASDQPERVLSCSKRPALDELTCYTNTASFLDVIAPGSRASVPDGPSGLGTSASTAYVTGVIALLLQSAPQLTPERVRATLAQTGKPIRDERNALTFPRVDALAAVQSVDPAQTGEIVTSDASLNPSALQLVLRGDGLRVSTLQPAAKLAQLEIYTLAGRRLYQTRAPGAQSLAWPLTDERGRRAPNAVYLVVLRLRMGSREQTQVIKLALLR